MKKIYYIEDYTAIISLVNKNHFPHLYSIFKDIERSRYCTIGQIKELESLCINDDKTPKFIYRVNKEFYIPATDIIKDGFSHRVLRKLNSINKSRHIQDSFKEYMKEYFLNMTD